MGWTFCVSNSKKKVEITVVFSMACHRNLDYTRFLLLEASHWCYCVQGGSCDMLQQSHEASWACSFIVETVG